MEGGLGWGRLGGTEGLWCLTGWGCPWRQHSQWSVGTQRPAWLRKSPCWHTQPGACPALQLPRVSVALGSWHVRSQDPRSPGATCCHISPEGHSAREDAPPPPLGSALGAALALPTPTLGTSRVPPPSQSCPFGSSSLWTSRPPITPLCSYLPSQMLVGPNSSLAFSKKPPLTRPVHFDLSICGNDFPPCGCSLLVSGPEPSLISVLVGESALNSQAGVLGAHHTCVSLNLHRAQSTRAGHV